VGGDWLSAASVDCVENVVVVVDPHVVGVESCLPGLQVESDGRARDANGPEQS
jgi:hypothetical protein